MQYRPELDGLRAMAVVMVVLFHADGPVTGGFVGVDLFFVLSAYLITSLLASEWRQAGSIDIKRFYWRRFLRLMPALLLLLATYMLVAPVIWPGHDHARDVVLTGLYLSDYSYAFAQLPFYLRHTWSLSVEEHFYLLGPLLLIPLLKARKPLALLLVAYLLATVWRLSFDDWVSYYYRFDTRSSGLILGAALALAAPKVSKPLFWCAVLALVAVALTARITESKFSITLAELASAVLILGAVQGHWRWLAHPALVRTGRLSYGIYLWHYPLVFAVRDQLSFAATAALGLAFSFVMASISYATVEAFGRRLKRGRPQLSARPQAMAATGPVQT